ncbi:uncharacterized protein JCM6883_004488 [Sporobolomyces salmoneus]|uniref:uncharacterized protein n=1 Tax=Sporobolomyces salmoneus TaxID=183962 RepID=UPI00317AFEC6
MPMPRRTRSRSFHRLEDEEAPHLEAPNLHSEPHFPPWNSRFTPGCLISGIPFFGPIIVFLFGFYFGYLRGSKLVLPTIIGALFVVPLVLMNLYGGYFSLETWWFVNRGYFGSEFLVGATFFYWLASIAICCFWLLMKWHDHNEELHPEQYGEEGIELATRTSTGRNRSRSCDTATRRRSASIHDGDDIVTSEEEQRPPSTRFGLAIGSRRSSSQSRRQSRQPEPITIPSQTFQRSQDSPVSSEGSNSSISPLDDQVPAVHRRGDRRSGAGSSRWPWRR